MAGIICCSTTVALIMWKLLSSWSKKRLQAVLLIDISGFTNLCTRLDVDEATARWLIERGVAKPTEAPDEPGVKPQFTARKGD